MVWHLSTLGSLWINLTTWSYRVKNLTRRLLRHGNTFRQSEKSWKQPSFFVKLRPIKMSSAETKQRLGKQSVVWHILKKPFASYSLVKLN